VHVQTLCLAFGPMTDVCECSWSATGLDSPKRDGVIYVRSVRTIADASNARVPGTGSRAAVRSNLPASFGLCSLVAVPPTACLRALAVVVYCLTSCSTAARSTRLPIASDYPIPQPLSLQHSSNNNHYPTRDYHTTRHAPEKLATRRHIQSSPTRSDWPASTHH
jgi:hypothetical protein